MTRVTATDECPAALLEDAATELDEERHPTRELLKAAQRYWVVPPARRDPIAMSSRATRGRTSMAAGESSLAAAIARNASAGSRLWRVVRPPRPAA